MIEQTLFYFTIGLLSAGSLITLYRYRIVGVIFSTIGIFLIAVNSTVGYITTGGITVITYLDGYTRLTLMLVFLVTLIVNGLLYYQDRDV
jgi:hypothetical protein